MAEQQPSRSFLPAISRVSIVKGGENPVQAYDQSLSGYSTPRRGPREAMQVSGSEMALDWLAAFAYEACTTT